MTAPTTHVRLIDDAEKVCMTVKVDQFVADIDLLDNLAVNLDRCFEQLVIQFQDRLYAFALRLSGNPQDAEEIAQDAFVRAYRALCGYDRERITALALRPWLYQITLNTFRNRIRGQRVQTVPLEQSNDRMVIEPAEDEREQPEAKLEQAERAHELRTHIAALPERYRVAVVLRHVEGFGYTELAELLDQPIGTIKANVHRGTRLLRTMLATSTEEVPS